MKKKVFSLMMTLLLAFVGMAKAEVVEIGVGGTSTNSYLPSYSFYNYSLTQQIYTAAEIGTAGTINSIAFFNSGSEKTRVYDLYMVNTTKSSFVSTTDWITVTAADKVFSGSVTMVAGAWTTITLDTPFAYDGASNLAVIADDNSGEWSSGMSCYVFDAPGMAIRVYSDPTNYDPMAPSAYTGTLMDVKNQIQLDITPGGGGAGAPYEAQIGEGTSTTGYFPFYTLYNYSIAENLFLASELQAAGVVAGPVTSLSWYATNAPGYEQQGISIWMANVTDTQLTTTSHVTTGMTLVYTGAMTPAIGWNEFPCNAGSFSWDGTSNLLIFCQRNNGDWNSTVYWQATATDFTSMSYKYQDSGAYDVTVPNTMTTGTNRSNIIIQGVGNSGGGGGGTGEQLVALQDGEVVDVINVGTRPNGYWMEPFHFNLRNDGPATTVNVIDFTPDGFFSYATPELPFGMPHNEEVEISVNTGTTTNTEWQMAVLYGEGRTAAVWPIVAEPYDPATPDVWELACEEATSFPFTEFPASAHNTTLHNDYTLPFPEIEEGNDAVYKLVFDTDMLLNAYVGSDAENGKVALYAENFGGEGGPMATNNYQGPTAGGGSGAAGAPFEVQIGEGTSTTGYFPFYTLYNYSIAENLFTAAELAEAGVTTAPMTSLSWYGTNAPGYAQQGISIWMANVSDTELTTTSHSVTGMTLVYTGAMTPAIGWNEFVFNEGTFSWDGQSNILIYCQRNNGSWNSTVYWQATASLPFNAMSYRYQDSGAYDPTVANTMYTSTTRPNIIMKADGRRDRATVPVTFNLTDSYGDGWNGAALNVNATDGTSESLTIASGSSETYTLDINEGAHVTLTWTSGSWDSECSFSVIMNGETIVSGGYGVLPFEFDIPGGSTPGPVIPEGVAYGPVIENAPVQAGTYYLVASSTDDDFEVFINAEELPCPEVDDFAFNTEPADDEDGVEPASVTLRWYNPANATECRVIIGTNYYPEIGQPYSQASDWMPITAPASSWTVRNLWNNTNYFWRVEFRNGGACSDGVSSPVFGFTTHLNVPQNLYAEDETIFNDEQVVLHWTAVVDRTYRYYFIYRDGVKVGETTMNQIGETTYSDGPLAYNMGGYNYYVTAVYDEGESAPSNTVNVKVSGRGNVDGHVYEQDGETGIANATVTMAGQDEFGANHTYSFQTNAQGYYSGAVYAGSYNGQAAKDGYQTITEPVQGNPIDITYNQTTSPVDYMLDENFVPVCTVIAEYYPDSLDPNSPYVKVYWGCGLPGEEIVEPFETGDFSLFDWQIDPSYPWSITTYNPYEGTYCMKSGGAGVANVVSNMTVTVNIPADGLMSYFGKISCESNWDYGYFYIDGVQKAQYTGTSNWAEKEFDITAGDHTFQWRYTKDGSVNSNDDCFYVDYITFYKRPEPPQPAQPGWHTYAESDFNNAVGSNVGTSRWAYEYPVSLLGSYAGFQMTKVSLFSDNMYSAVGGNYTCTIYRGGNEPMEGEAISTITVDVPSNQNAWVDFDLTTPVAVTGTEKLWVVWQANSTVSSWPAGCCDGLVEEGTWWSAGLEAGYGWEHETYGTWTMRQYFTNRNGEGFYSLASGRQEVNAPVVMKGAPVMPVKGQEIVATSCVNPNAERIGGTNSTRALSHYRIYRTNCYNDGPYTLENTVLLATNWPGDTIYIDVEWTDLEPGVYKWGVGVVYVGNRGEEIESPITWAAPVNITRDVTADNNPNPVAGEDNGNRAPWDLLNSFDCTSGYQYGVATDGNYIYTCSWSASSSSQFYKYTMDGTFVEEFNVSGSGQIRDLTYDGTYFYGVANSTTIYCLDLANHTLVSTIPSSYGSAMRCCGYDPQRDGFWVVGNWSGNLTLINRQGAVVTIGPAPTSASGVAYYKDANNVEHVYCFDNGTNQIWDYDIASNTIVGTVFDFSATPGYASGSSGGCHIANYGDKLAFYGDLQQSPNLIGIYELRDADNGGGGGGGNTGNNPIQEPRESEIVWSNCLDKDMYLSIADVNVLLNSADSPEGTVVTFENYNEVEQQLYPVAPITMDETGFYAFDSFRRGAYKVTVTKEGYETIIDSINFIDSPNNLLTEMHLRYVMIEILYGVENVYVSRTGWAMWDDSHNNPGGGGGGGGQGGSGDTFTVNFDDSQIPAGWTTIDGGTPMGYGWQIGSTKLGSTGNGHNGSADLVLSQSYDNNYGVVYPDNWLISPAVTLGSSSQFSLWACGQDAGYAAEHFGVFVSTTGTNPSDFTMVQEWTLTAKGERYNGPRGNRDQGNWYQKTVDLGAYAGTGRYIAVRHFNCSDMFYLDVDDLELTNGAKNTDEMEHFEYYKVLCTSIDGVPIYNDNTVHPFCQLSTDEPFNAPLVEGEHYLCKVATVYSTGMSPWSEPVEWVYEPCDHWGPVDVVTVSPTGNGNLVEWVFENGYNPYGGGGGGGGGGTGTGDWYFYDDGNNVDAIGTGGGQFYWAVMFPAGSYTGNQVTKVSNYDYMAMSGTASIYQGGDTAPAGSALGQTSVTFTGSNQFVEFEFANPVNIDPTQNVWVVFYNASGATYPASVSGPSGQANARWISLDGVTWEDMLTYGLDYTFQLRAYIFDGAKGNYYGAPTMASGMISNDTYALNLSEIENFNERIITLYNLVNDGRFSVINSEQEGVFIVSLNDEGNLAETISEFLSYNAKTFAMMEKEEAAATALNYKAQLPFEMAQSLMMDIYVKSRDNALCADALPFCTDNGMYEFPAGVNAGSGETGPDYDCLYTTPNPAWYYMRIGNPGDIDIYMYSTPSVDIDFCCWGPFDDPTTPCPYGLTENKVVSCSYSANPTEHCMIPANAQTGEYYILVITNYSNQACNINFSKVAGNGDTDCGILPPVDIIGFLITQDGQFLAFADATDREYLDVDEYGEHVYCVRPIYPGEMTLPDHNYGWSMGCPVCTDGGGGQITCEAGDDIDYTYDHHTDEVTVFWGEQIVPLEEWLYYDDGTYATSVGAGGTLYWGTMFPANSLQAYAGTSLTKVAVHTSYACSATLNVYVGGAQPSGSPAVTQTFTMAGDQEFMEITLNTPVPVDGTQNLWITFYQSGETYPADACADTGDANNRWVSVDGASWLDLASAGLPGYGWMIRGFVTNQAKGGELAVLPEFKGNVGGTISNTEVVSKPADMSFMNRDRAEIVKYNVYRSSDNETYEFLGDVAAVAGQNYYEYIDSPAVAGTYYYQVRAEYDNGCESEPALRKNAHQYNYVEVAVTTGVGENGTAVYPNPTKGNVTIEAAGMQHVTVVSVLGQVVYDADVEGDQLILNMSQYSAGMYTVRVTTESGVSVNRITVVR